MKKIEQNPLVLNLKKLKKLIELESACPMPRFRQIAKWEAEYCAASRKLADFILETLGGAR